MSEDAFFRVTFIRPDGWSYATTGRAESAKEAVRLADELLEHVERIGISDYLLPDGLTVRSPARLAVERVSPREAGPGVRVGHHRPGRQRRAEVDVRTAADE